MSLFEQLVAEFAMANSSGKCHAEWLHMHYIQLGQQSGRQYTPSHTLPHRYARGHHTSIEVTITRPDNFTCRGGRAWTRRLLTNHRARHAAHPCQPGAAPAWTYM